MSNNFKENFKMDVASMIEKDPDLQKAKKILFNGLSCLLGVRIIFLIVEIFFNFSRDISFTMSIPKLISFLIAMFFSIGIYRFGMKGLTLLLLAGALYSMYMTPLRFDLSDRLSILYSILAIITIIIQIVTMTIFLTNRKCKKYFTIISIKSKELANEAKKTQKKTS